MSNKKYYAAEDSIIEGKPTAQGAEVKGVPEDALKAYIKAGIVKEMKDEELSAEAKQLQEDAKKIDTTSDKRTEK